MKVALQKSNPPVSRKVDDSRMAGRLQVVCAWCKTDMGTKKCISQMDGQVSHGICTNCSAALHRRHSGKTYDVLIGGAVEI